MGLAARVLGILLLLATFPGSLALAAAPPAPAPARDAQSSQPGGASTAPSAADLAGQELAKLNTAALQPLVDQAGAALPGSGFGWPSLGQLLHGGGVLLHPSQLITSLSNLLVGELRANLGLLARLLVLVVLAAAVRQLHGAFESETVGRVADAAVFLALGVVCLAGFSTAVHLARSAVADLSSFLLAMLPALVGLLAATGSVTSATLVQPALVAAVTGVSLVVRVVILPLVVLAAVLDVVSALNPDFRLTGLAGLLRQWSLLVLGLASTVFLGVVAVQGMAGAVADGVAWRTGKYAVRSLLPVVGGLISDAADLVLTSGLLLRSGLGLIGLVTVALLVVVPVLKLLALSLIYRGAAALAQPVGGEAVAGVLGGLGSAVVLLTAAVAVVGLMCFLALAVLVGAGGAVWAAR